MYYNIFVVQLTGKMCSVYPVILQLTKSVMDNI